MLDVKTHPHKEGSLGWDYYTIQAVPDSKAHRIQVVTAYIAKNKNGAVRVPDVQAPGSTSQNEARLSYSTPSVPQLGEEVNGEGLPENQGQQCPPQAAGDRRQAGPCERHPLPPVGYPDAPGCRCCGKAGECQRGGGGGYGDLDGLYDGRTNTLHISAKAQNPVRVVFTHEITHAMKTSNRRDTGNCNPPRFR